MNFDLGDINKELYRNALRSATDFLNSYVENEDKIIDVLKQFGGIKTEIYLKEIDKNLDEIIKFSSIFSDVTVLNHTTSSIKSSQWTYFDPNSKYFRDRKLTVNTNDLENLHYSFFDFTPVYIHRTTEDVKKLANKFSSLFSSQKLLMRPLRGISAHNKLNQTNVLHYVNPNTDNDHWLIDNIDIDSLLIDNGLKPTQVMKLFELTLPYFTEIKIEDLSKILTDETDLLSGFRSNLKKVIQESGNLKTLNEIRQDLLNPEIDKINGKFKHIKNVHKISIAGTVGSFTLSLLIAVYTGSEIAKIITPIVPLGGLIASEVKYQDSISDLRNNNYFLLWRINKSVTRL